MTGCKKKLVESISYSQRLSLVDKTITISQNRQASLLKVSVSSLYYARVYCDYELEVMWQIDAIYTEHVYYGARRISQELKKRWYQIWRKKTKTYMHTMGICAMYPKKNTSKPNIEHKKFPYLLKGVQITRANQVWSTDITYIKLPHWFVYLIAVIDWYSRKIIARDLSPTMDKTFCCWVLTKALEQWKPEIFNTDQGSQFTSHSFIEILENQQISISMDGIWRCYDNIRIERLWRTIKYEDIHINEYQTPNEVFHWLSIYLNKYNETRLHSSLWYKTPSQVYECWK